MAGPSGEAFQGLLHGVSSPRAWLRSASRDGRLPSPSWPTGRAWRGARDLHTGPAPSLEPSSMKRRDDCFPGSPDPPAEHRSTTGGAVQELGRADVHTVRTELADLIPRRHAPSDEANLQRRGVLVPAALHPRQQLLVGRGEDALVLLVSGFHGASFD